MAGVKIPSLFKGAGVTITALDCPWKAAEEHNLVRIVYKTKKKKKVEIILYEITWYWTEGID